MAVVTDRRATSDLRALSDVLEAADEDLLAGRSAGARVVPTGFRALDTYLGAGLRSGELILLGGPQGLGKTTFALQILRNVVAAGGSAVYFSFEHDHATVLERLLAMEAAAQLGSDALTLRRVRQAMEAVGGRPGTLADRLAEDPGGLEAIEAIASYGDRFSVHRSSGSLTSVETIRDTVAEVHARTGQPPLVIVDYLQKVFVPGGSVVEEERVTRIVEDLKDLALDVDVAVLAVVAADREGLVTGRRLRIHHLRGSASLAYEADVVLLMNDKYDVVARHHLVYDAGQAERFRDFVVISIEKNRSGLDRIDVEFRKHFDQGCFDSDGSMVSEQLVDERVYAE